MSLKYNFKYTPSCSLPNVYYLAAFCLFQSHTFKNSIRHKIISQKLKEILREKLGGGGALIYTHTQH